MSNEAEQLARLRVAVVTGSLPRDLGIWLLDRLDSPQRNALLRAAADQIHGSRWTKAQTLADMLDELRAFPGLMKFVYPPESAMHAVQAALRLDPQTPASVRQILRVLSD